MKSINQPRTQEHTEVFSIVLQASILIPRRRPPREEIKPKHTNNTDMQTEKNALIAEFKARFPNDTRYYQPDDSADAIRQVLYDILQHYQRDIRSKGVPGDWKLTREYRTGLFGSISGQKAFIFDASLSISTSRERLLILDGLQDTAPGMDVQNPIEGSLLDALRPENRMDDHLELQQILEHFAQDEEIDEQLKRRGAIAKINTALTQKELLGNARLGQFINFVIKTLQLKYTDSSQLCISQKSP